MKLTVGNGKTVVDKMKIKTSPVLVLDTFTVLRSKSYWFS